MFSILGETVKVELVKELVTNFPNVETYKEKNDDPNFPNFFVLLLELNKERIINDYYSLEYFFTIRYRQIADINLDPKLQDNLDDMALDMMYHLRSIEINGLRLPLYESRYEKVDGVLHYFCNVKLRVSYAQLERAKQMSLDLDILPKKEDK